MWLRCAAEEVLLPPVAVIVEAAAAAGDAAAFVCFALVHFDAAEVEAAVFERVAEGVLGSETPSVVVFVDDDASWVVSASQHRAVCENVLLVAARHGSCLGTTKIALRVANMAT